MPFGLHFLGNKKDLTKILGRPVQMIIHKINDRHKCNKKKGI